MNSVNTKREELHPLLAGGAVYRVGDEFVGQLRDRLQAARHQRARRAVAPISSAAIADHDDRHEQRRIGERDLVPADVAERARGCGSRIDESDRPSPEASCSLVAQPIVLLSRSAGNTRGAHHVEDAGGEAEQEKHDHPPRRDSEPLVERPADERADQDTGDQFGGEPEAAGERRRIALRTGTQLRLAGSALSGGRAVRRDAGASRRERPRRLTGCRFRSRRPCLRPCLAALNSTPALRANPGNSCRPKKPRGP